MRRVAAGGRRRAGVRPDHGELDRIAVVKAYGVRLSCDDESSVAWSATPLDPNPIPLDEELSSPGSIRRSSHRPMRPMDARITPAAHGIGRGFMGRDQAVAGAVTSMHTLVGQVPLA